MSWKSIKSFIAATVLNFLSIFNRKKQKTAVLSEIAATTAAPIAPPKMEVQRPAARIGSVYNITAMLDQEAVELYGRSPHVK